MKHGWFILLVAAGLAFPPLVNSAEKNSKDRKGRNAQDVALMMEAGPASDDFQCLELLGFPTDTSIQIHLIPRRAMKLMVEYGAGLLDQQTKPESVRAGESKIIELTGLKPDTEYFYRIKGDTHRFHTARPKGATFWPRWRGFWPGYPTVRFSLPVTPTTCRSGTAASTPTTGNCRRDAPCRW